MTESPLFTKSYQFLLWIMQKTQKFPKSQRFVLAARLNLLILNFYDLIIETTKVKDKLSRLIRADIELEKLRITFRICKDLELITIKQYC